MNQQEELKIIRDKIVEGMKTLPQRLLEKKKKLGQQFVVVENGEIKIIDARDLE